MNSNIEKEILLRYLNRSYCIKENRFFSKFLDYQEWGINITKSLTKIFSFDLVFCSDVFKEWAYQCGMTDEHWSNAYGIVRLQTTWSPELANDISACHFNAEEELAKILLEQVTKEIDNDDFTKLSSGLKTTEEIVSIIKCFGYEPSETEYNQFTFAPVKRFSSMKNIDIKNERDSNPIWQDYVRTRERYQEA